MPIYGFACKRCDHEFETLVRSSDVPECPSCGSEKLEQKLSLIAAPAKNGADAPMCRGGGQGGGPCGMCCGSCD